MIKPPETVMTLPFQLNPTSRLPRVLNTIIYLKCVWFTGRILRYDKKMVVLNGKLFVPLF